MQHRRFAPCCHLFNLNVEVVGAGKRTRRWHTRIADRNTVDPLSVGLSLAQCKLNIVSNAIAGREQLDVSSILVEDFGGLGVLEANAGSEAWVLEQRDSLAGVVPDVNLVGLSERNGCTECQHEG